MTDFETLAFVIKVPRLSFRDKKRYAYTIYTNVFY